MRLDSQPLATIIDDQDQSHPVMIAPYPDDANEALQDVKQDLYESGRSVRRVVCTSHGFDVYEESGRVSRHGLECTRLYDQFPPGVVDARYPEVLLNPYPSKDDVWWDVAEEIVAGHPKEI